MSVLPEVVTEAFGVALVGYVASLSLAQGSAKKFKYSVDDNQVKLILLSVTEPWNHLTVWGKYYRWMPSRKSYILCSILTSPSVYSNTQILSKLSLQNGLIGWTATFGVAHPAG